MKLAKYSPITLNRGTKAFTRQTEVPLVSKRANEINGQLLLGNLYLEVTP